jgi:hypothetical protein
MRRARREVAVVGSLLFALGACFAPQYPEGLVCSERMTCPPGQTCDGTICRAALLDAASGGPDDAASVDAAVVADASAVDAAAADATLDPASIWWARSLSGASPIGVAEGADGLIVTGYFSTIAALGGAVLESQGDADTVVASFATSDASHLYSTRFGGAGGEYGFFDHLDPLGAPLIVGVAYGTYDLGQGPLVGGGGPGADGFIGRYGPAGPSWVKRAVGPGEDKLVATALGSSTVFAIGWYEASTSVDTTSHSSVGGRDILFTRWQSSTGELEISRSFGGAGRDEGTGIASATSGDVVAIGFFEGGLVLGATTLVAAGGLDVWVARFTADGVPGWAVRFGGAGDEREPKVSTDAAGDVYIAGQFSAATAFGAVTLTPVGGSDVFVAKLRGADGAVLWATSIGSAGPDTVSDIAVDAAGRVYVTATVGGAIEPGGPYAGALDAALVSFDGVGARRWARVLGTAGDDRAWTVAVGSDAIYYGLSVAGPVDLGGVPIIGAPDPHGLLLKLQP